MHLWMYSLWTNHNRRRLKVLFSPEIREGWTPEAVRSVEREWGGEGEKGKHCPQKGIIIGHNFLFCPSWCP